MAGRMQAKPKRAIKPRDAATLVLVRSHDDGPRVLMGRRPGGHVFMPDKFVFPGGRVARGDGRVHAERELRPRVERRLGLHARGPKARALALTAIRETFEETGLLVGKRAAARRSRAPVWSEYFARGVAPDLGALDFIARAITPPGSPRRFDARFFLADADTIQNARPESADGDGELVDLRWFRLYEARRLDLPAITRLVVDEIDKRYSLRPEERERVPVPFYAYGHGGPRLELLD